MTCPARFRRVVVLFVHVTGFAHAPAAGLPAVPLMTSRADRMVRLLMQPGFLHIVAFRAHAGFRFPHMRLMAERAVLFNIGAGRLFSLVVVAHRAGVGHAVELHSLFIVAETAIRMYPGRALHRLVVALKTLFRRVARHA